MQTRGQVPIQRHGQSPIQRRGPAIRVHGAGSRPPIPRHVAAPAPSEGGQEAPGPDPSVYPHYAEFSFEPFARIKVIGVGGAGGNAINRMVEAGVEGIEFVSVNTDAQALMTSEAPMYVRIGDKLTKG
ncbi:MAG: hypothetical protein M3R06_10140, partial [Chloroflexota bacterium]|nr:hypothetical protein [Chloroflexota bacterium]